MRIRLIEIAKMLRVSSSTLSAELISIEPSRTSPGYFRKYAHFILGVYVMIEEVITDPWGALLPPRVDRQRRGRPVGHERD